METYDQLIEQVKRLSATERTGFLRKLPQDLVSDDQNHLASSSLDATKDGAKVDILTKSINDLSAPDKQKVSNNTLGKPSDRTRDKIWMVVIWAFVVLIVGSFLTLTISLFLPSGTPTDARVQIILTVFTTAAAFLTGLLAPSPMSTKQVN